MSMKKVYVNSKKKRLVEGKPCTLKLNIQDAQGKKTEVNVLVKKLTAKTMDTHHINISTAKMKNNSHRITGFGPGIKVPIGVKKENNTQENCYRFCTYKERIKRRKQLQCWNVIDSNLGIFSPNELIGTNIVVTKAGKKVGGVIETARIIETKPIKRPAPPIEKH